MFIYLFIFLKYLYNDGLKQDAYLRIMPQIVANFVGSTSCYKTFNKKKSGFVVFLKSVTQFWSQFNFDQIWTAIEKLDLRIAVFKEYIRIKINVH